MTATLHLGDCLDVLRTLPDASVHCCVTSPPYFGLRDYGHSDQIGLEPTPDEFVAKLVAAFREVRRVLRDDGTLWLNLGDSYSATQTNNGGCSPMSTLGGGGGRYREGSKNAAAYEARETRRRFDGAKPKDLLGIPWRVAFALQSDGWYLRQDIIWHKHNPMPESVRDRCTKAHEYVFLMTKSERYFYDADAVSEAMAASTLRAHQGKNVTSARGKVCDAQRGGGDKGLVNGNDRFANGTTRNRRSVWTVTTKPFHGAHFAVMPPALVEPCILAGCPKDGVVLDPFTGSGTVGEVALLSGRQFVGIELNPDYHAIAERRITKAAAAGHQLGLNF